jgi:hypothetical protein
LSTFALDEIDESPSSRKLVLVDIDRKQAEKLTRGGRDNEKTKYDLN